MTKKEGGGGVENAKAETKSALQTVGVRYPQLSLKPARSEYFRALNRLPYPND